MKEQYKRVELIDLLNDLQKEVEIKKRIEENLKSYLDKPVRFNSSSGNNVNSSTFNATSSVFLTTMSQWRR